MKAETRTAINIVKDNAQNITGGETPPVNVSTGDEAQNLALPDSGIFNEDFVTGLTQLEDQLIPVEDNIKQNIDIDDPGPGPEPNYLEIEINSPANGTPFYGTASQGVAITASGTVAAKGYTIETVTVKFGSPSSKTATRNGINWTCTGGQIKTNGQIEITAKVTGKNIKSGNPFFAIAKRTVTVSITDDIAPTVTITQPATNGFQVKNVVNGKFTFMLQASATDNMSGVKRVEYSLDGSNLIQGMQLVQVNGQSVWQAEVKLPFRTTPRTISVHAIDNVGKVSAVSQRSVQTVDESLPTLQITLPPKSTIDLPGTDAAGAILPRLEGSAKDSQSGVQSVEWSLNNSPYQPAVLQSINNGVKWNVQNIAIPGPAGPKTIKVRCRNGAGNLSAEKVINVAVSLQYPPKDPTVQEYFSSLLDFIVRRVKSTALNRFLRVDDLKETFYQPFQNVLSGDSALYTERVHQIRICIEALRRHFDKTAATLATSPILAQARAILQTAEAAYRQRAYETLLSKIGTSFEEIRSIRLLEFPALRALAQRLGFDITLRSVDQSGPENPLQQFQLQPGQFAEAQLETLFGLIDTTRDPLEKRDFNPTLLDLQLDSLKTGWAKQDDVAGRPIIDPDLMGEADLYSDNPAYKLWQDRQTWVTDQLAAFRTQLQQIQSKGSAAFDELVSSVIGPVRDMQALQVELDAGGDIEPQLSEKHLTLAAFVRLMKLRKLAGAGKLLDSEVDEAASILLQAQKLGSFARWREEEQGAGLVLSPDFFRIPTALDSIDLPQVSPEWRVSVEARRRWQDTLKARIDQQRSLRQALLSVIDAAEEESLPLLRDGLVKAMAKLSFQPDGIDSLSQFADQLTQRLLIDVKTSGYQRLTRVEQAIQTLQNLLINLRMGTLVISSFIRDTASEVEKDFDEELRWIGAYATWYSAMQVFLYPENLLLPTLRPAAEKSSAFKTLIEKLRANPQLTPEKAREFASPFNITEQRTKGELLALRNQTRAEIDAATLPVTDPATTRLQKITRDLKERYYFVPIALALQLQKSGQYLAALDWFRLVYAYDLPASQRKIYYALELERDPTPNDPKLLYQRNVYWLKDSLNPHDIVVRSYTNPNTARYDAYTRFVVISLVRCLLDFADTEFTHDTNESLPRARSLYMQALELLNTPEVNPKLPAELSLNPIMANLKLRAQVNLDKLRSGRNMTGLKRQLEQLPTAGQSIGLLPLIVASSPFGTSSSRTLQPTPYRYTALVDRAKQLVTIAQQVEAAYLAALEKRDVEAYNLLRASQDLGLAQANIQLQNLRVVEAADSLTLAERQKERAEFQVEAYRGFLDAGMNQWERKLLDDYHNALVARNWVAGLDAALTVAETFTHAAGNGILGTGIGAHWGISASVAALAVGKAAASIAANNAEADIQRHSLRASFENRQQEWALQKGLSEKDVAISDQHIQLAKDHQRIVGQEQIIALLQTANAQATVEFLSRKFTNVELYEWMSGVLQEVYSYFLQQATAMARLAQNQLAFERQAATPMFIKNDYWQPPSEESGLGDSSEPDRRGLTGSARLLQDIYELDQFAFETNKRKLQLTKTISLSQLAPLEFQRFRETGVLTFATPMPLFDRDFPGHYLRLIKRVRTSVVALIPPNQGIRATLTASGLSRVVSGGDVFQAMTVRRDMESVALTSSLNATGLFELEPQADLLLPFEFMGVDTVWNLEMPKAANPFDYRTIADVLLTIDYTALNSLDYRRQVIQQLDRTISADRVYSFRNQFADQWYDLHNPEQTATPMTVSFSTTREDFPSNVEQLTIGQVALYFVLADGKTIKDFRAQLHATERGSSARVGGEATATPDGIISTRLGNASSWVPMLNRSPFGIWELAFPDRREVRDLFASEVISDILFVITCSGQTPQWPL
ncbi:MAG: neuraminidase-like domain-containing protein [Blastocatellia bacterium]